MTGDPNALRRAFVTVGSRQVHYRRAGAGPAAVLLHESPRSSASMSWLIRPLARRFCVLAFDTPGYGSSTRFEAESPAIADYAHTLAGALDALGVEQCGVYGVHTGAAIALELARRDPQRVTCAVLDGLPLYSDDESSELLEHYAPTFAPRIDGAHLAALWTCYRDRFLFSPWYRRERLTRRDVAMPEPDALHEGVMDMLRSGNGYGAGYAAAFRFRAVPAIADLTVPTTILEHEGDLLAGQVDRLGELPESASVLRLPTDRKQSADVIGGLLAAHAPVVSVPPAPPTGAVAGTVWRDYADTRYGQLLVRRAGEGGAGFPLVMLHASPGSAEMLVGLVTHLAPGRQVFALDTLGNGDSDKPPWDEAEIGDYAPVVADAAQALGLEQFDLYGSHTGGLIALETALLVPERVRRLVLDGVTLHDAEETADLLAHYTPALRPSEDGTHLLFAWNFLRDQTLFWPWYNRSRDGIRWVDPVDAEQLHVWFVELLKSGETYPIGYRAAFRYRTGERIPLLSVPALMVARSTDMLHSTTHAAAKLAPNARAETLPERNEDAARMIASFLDEPDR